VPGSIVPADRVTTRPWVIPCQIAGAGPIKSKRSKPVALAPYPLPPMYQVESYRGVLEGWHPVGRPRSHAEALALLHRVRQIRPDFVTRSRCLGPELFPIG